MLTAYDMYYEHFINKGYSTIYASVCAENEVKKIREEAEVVYQPINVNVSGIGNCLYSGE